MKSVTIYVDENDKEYIIQIGGNKNENNELIKAASQNDLWFHLGGDISSPHIILKSEGDKIPKRYINYIGTLFPLYKNNMTKRYSVIYTEIKNVKLTDKKGTVITSKTQKINY